MSYSLKSNQAFSLAELIATIAIISILAAIIVPNMTRYIAQSKVTEAILAAGPIQSQIVKNIAENETVTGSGLNVIVPTNLGSYVSSVVVSDDGIITITMDSSAASVQLTLSPSYNSSSDQVSWVCAVSNSSFNNYVSDECRI